MRIMLTNCPADMADRIAEDLVERRIAACVNAVDIRSTYRWEGRICREPETTLLIKVAEEAVAAAKARILELHPYDLPEILVLPVDRELSLTPYISWVRGEARGGERPDRALLYDARSRAMAFLVKALRPDGSFGADVPDLAAYYRVPLAMASAGWADGANRVLDHIARSFLSAEGCLRHGTPASEDDPQEHDEFWTIANAWVAIGASRLGRYELVWPLVRCLMRSSQDASGGFLSHGRRPGDAVTDLRTAATVGWALLATGRVERAVGAGRWIRDLLEAQPEPSDVLYLRRDEQGRVLTQFDADSSFVHAVRASARRQAWFVPGQAMGFLTLLARATGDPSWRETAGRLLGFLRGADPSMLRDPNAHKVAWGASLYAQDTGDAAALAMAGRVAAWLVEGAAGDGGWLPDARPQERLGRTAEIALWLGEIASTMPD